MKKRLLIMGMALMMLAATGCGKDTPKTPDTKQEANKDAKNDTQVDTQKDDAESNDTKKDDNTSYKSADEITMEDLMNHPETPAEDFEYQERKSSESVRLLGYVGKDPIVVIPDEINGYKVTGFGTILANNENIVAVRVGNNVTKVEWGAFGNCKNLKYVVLGNAVKEVEGSIFVGTNIEEFQLNEGLEVLGTDQDDDCVYAPLDKMGISLKVPESVTKMGVRDFSLIVKAGSYAETYAKENEIPYTVE